MPKESSGIMMYRRGDSGIEVFLVHPGGPFWKKKDFGAWSVPKGEHSSEEDSLAAARREFREETGFSVDGDFLPLAPLRQKSGKVIHAWAVEGACDPDRIQSNTFEIEWPPKSGVRTAFPEVDRAGWFGITEARRRIHPGQVGFIDELLRQLPGEGSLKSP